MYLTLKQCADLAKIGISSARFYKDKPEFKPYFITIGEGRNTKYQETSTVETLTLISKAYTDNLDADQIVELLENRYGVITDLVTQEGNNNTTTTQQEDLTNSIRAIFIEEIAKRDSLILHLQQELVNTKEELQQELSGIKQSLVTLHERGEDGLRGSERRDADIMSMMRDLQADKQRKWWQKLFSK